MGDKIRPIYAELKGYLSQAPDASKGYIFDSALWEQYNRTIDELNNVSEKDYNRYKAKIESAVFNRATRSFIRVQPYRSNLSGLIARLHAEYFSNEQEPFGGSPASIVSFNQSQSQSTHIQILLDIQNKINEKIRELEAGTKEHKFLERIKKSLSNVRNVVELLNIILKSGKDLGLTIDQIAKLFS